MKYKPRWYQEESAQAIANAISINKQIHPVAVLPTGSGKTYTICETINLAVTAKPELNVLILSHVAEILDQNKASLESFFGFEVGLYSAGLGSKTIKKITVAGIQSVHNKPELFKDFGLIIIDECHLVPIDPKSMYRKFLSNIEANYVGLTATPYRLKHGYIHEGSDALFNCIAYDLSKIDQYNRLVEEGYLSPMFGKGTQQRLDAEKENVKTVAGDYDLKQLSSAFDREEITEAALNEVEQFGAPRKLWLIFAIDIEHAEHIAESLRKRNKKVICVHSKMQGDRKQIIREIKELKYDAVVNVDVLTTGFDAPQIDLIVDLAPTKSASKHVQKMGRGARVHPEKPNCLVLDFAGNIARLGPINNPIPPHKVQKTKGNGEGITKECPECQLITHPTTKICAQCGHEYQFKQKITMTAAEGDAQAKQLVNWLDVKKVSYSAHNKKGSPGMMRVTYKTGLNSFSEYICFDHHGYAGHLAKNWVKRRWRGRPEKFPESTQELLKSAYAYLKEPLKIKVDTTSKYPSIKDYKFTETQ